MESPVFFSDRRLVERAILCDAVDPQAILASEYQKMHDKLTPLVGSVVMDSRSYCVHGFKSATQEDITQCMRLDMAVYVLLTDPKQAELGEWVFLDENLYKHERKITLCVETSRNDREIAYDTREFVRRERYFQRTK